jgi:hypothetical protein
LEEGAVHELFTLVAVRSAVGTFSLESGSRGLASSNGFSA